LHLAQPRAKDALPGDESGTARGAALLALVVGEEHSFFGDAIDVGRSVADHALGEDSQIRNADVVAPDDEHVGFVPGGHFLGLSLTRKEPGAMRKVVDSAADNGLAQLGSARNMQRRCLPQHR
jgi:hypothetical protein